MVVASADVTCVSTDLGGLPNFHLTIVVSASDGTNTENSVVLVNVAAASTTADINAAIVSAITTWVNGQHSWALDPKNLYFQPFANGS